MSKIFLSSIVVIKNCSWKKVASIFYLDTEGTKDQQPFEQIMKTNSSIYLVFAFEKIKVNQR